MHWLYTIPCNTVAVNNCTVGGKTGSCFISWLGIVLIFWNFRSFFLSFSFTFKKKKLVSTAFVFNFNMYLMVPSTQDLMFFFQLLNFVPSFKSWKVVFNFALWMFRNCFWISLLWALIIFPSNPLVSGIIFVVFAPEISSFVRYRTLWQLILKPLINIWLHFFFVGYSDRSQFAVGGNPTFCIS